MIQRQNQLEFAGPLARRALVAHKSVMVGQMAPEAIRTACHNCEISVTTIGLDIEEEVLKERIMMRPCSTRMKRVWIEALPETARMVRLCDRVAYTTDELCNSVAALLNQPLLAKEPAAASG